jgi:chemotaxis protein methyltransferase CheR
MLTNEQFDRTRKLALRLAGIELLDRHRALLKSRTRRLGIRDIEGFDALLGAAEKGHPQASGRLIGLVTTKFTGFFRHPRHFDLAAGHALRAAHRQGQARLWSAAAATGEEPYSLAMAALEAFRQHDPPLTILATDIDAEALATAERGEYGERALQRLQPERRTRFFNPTGVARRWSIARDVSRLVTFHALNLADAVWPVEGPLDVIFCRNVLMYLEACHRYAVLERIASLLAPEGLLFLDPTEHLGDAAHWFSPEADGLYLRRHSAAAPQRARFRLSPSSRRTP